MLAKQDNVKKERGYRNLNVIINNSTYEGAHTLTDTEILYAIKGSSNVIIENTVYRLMLGDIIIINSGDKYSIKPDSESINAHIYIEPKEFESIRKNLRFFCNSSIDRVNDYSELRGIIRDIIKISANSNKDFDLRKKGMEYLLLDCLIRNYLLSNQIEQNRDTSEFLWDDVFAYIKQRIDSHISLDEVSKMMFTTKSSFSRLFKQKTGVNFSQYLIQARIEHSVMDLENSESSITQIASEHGFANTSAFSSTFRKFYGMSPSEYRNRHIGNANSRIAISKPNIEELLQNKESAEFFIRVDVRLNEVVDFVWGRAIGFGNARDLLDGIFQKQVLILKDMLNAKYLTLTNILSLLVSEDGQAIHFDLLERILFFCVDHKLTPIFVLGRATRRIVLSQDGFLKSWYDPKIEDEESLYLSLIKFIADRFGAKEASEWIFRIYHVDDFESKTEYLERLKYTRAAVKKYLPGLLVGQCSYIVGSGQANFIDDVARQDIQADFVSITAYPYEHYIYKSRYSLGNSTQTRSRCLVIDECKKMKRDMIKAGIADAKVYMSDWNMSISDRNAYNDSCGKAAHMLETMIGLHGEIDFECFSEMFDLSYYYNDEKRLLFGGRGVIGHVGTLKPSFFALYFMNRLGKLVIKKGDSFIVTSDGNGTYDIVLANPKRFSESYYHIPENKVTCEMLDQIYEDDTDRVVSIELSGLTDGDYIVKKHFLNEENDILSAVFASGMDVHYLTEDYGYFRRRGFPQLKADYRSVVNGSLAIESVLRRNQIEWIHIAPRYFSRQID